MCHHIDSCRIHNKTFLFSHSARSSFFRIKSFSLWMVKNVALMVEGTTNSNLLHPSIEFWISLRRTKLDCRHCGRIECLIIYDYADASNVMPFISHSLFLCWLLLSKNNNNNNVTTKVHQDRRFDCFGKMGHRKKNMIKRFVSIKLWNMFESIVLVRLHFSLFTLSPAHACTCKELSHTYFIYIICDLLVSVRIYMILSEWALHWLRQIKISYIYEAKVYCRLHTIKYER